ncbi:YolD-like family protein [Alkalihalobacillus deserti]|uniref:YolD-like family protein n=1 Tax=Alkalihalobacillus deserti TaxID=2879466 RepID=UPI001D140BC3|nr:YolD-like family protein [Alkalihalobacillus deserti]
MMLPEHVEAIRHRKEEQEKLPKHELDEQELEEIGLVIMDSLNHALDVCIAYWRDGYYHEIIGVVDRVDMQMKKIKLRIDDTFEYIRIDCLKAVESI